MRYSMTANEIYNELEHYATRCVLEMRQEGFSVDDIVDAIYARAHELIRKSGRQQADRALKERILCLGMVVVDVVRKQHVGE